MIEFPISGVETHWWLPLITTFVISMFTSTGGVSGAFLLLPFQMSVLGFTGPAVSATNMLYNVIAIPGGVYRYAKEKRLVKPLVWTTILGTLPGVFIPSKSGSLQVLRRAGSALRRCAFRAGRH